MARMILRVELMIDLENGRVVVSKVQQVASLKPLEGAAPVAQDIATITDSVFHDAAPPATPNVVAPTRQEGRLLQQLLGLGLEEDYISAILKNHSADRLSKLAAWVLKVRASQGATDTAALFRTCLNRSAGRNQ